MIEVASKRLEEQLKFVLEIDKEKEILRQTHLTSGRRENDAEHAWHMAIMIYLLKEYANEEFDLAKAMMMALIHDIVEIDAGDRSGKKELQSGYMVCFRKIRRRNCVHFFRNLRMEKRRNQDLRM